VLFVDNCRRFSQVNDMRTLKESSLRTVKVVEFACIVANYIALVETFCLSLTLRVCLL